MLSTFSPALERRMIVRAAVVITTEARGMRLSRLTAKAMSWEPRSMPSTVPRRSLFCGPETMGQSTVAGAAVSRGAMEVSAMGVGGRWGSLDYCHDNME